MPIVHRRTFIGKVGSADQIIDLIKEEEQQLQGLGVAFKSRVLSDYLNGRTDRVVWEIEAEDILSVEKPFEEAMADPKGQEIMGAWFGRLTELIHYAESENWRIH